jgi:hypothetical protein
MARPSNNAAGPDFVAALHNEIYVIAISADPLRVRSPGELGMIGDPIARFDAVATSLVLRNEQEMHRTHPSALAPPSRAKNPAAAPPLAEPG